MDRLIFAQAISRIKVLETRLLDKAKFDRMIESPSAEEALKIIQENEYSIHLGKIKKPQEYDILLSEELKRIYALLVEVSPVKGLVDMMSIRYDYHNIKVLLKAKALEANLDYLLIDIGTVDLDKLKVYINSEDYVDLSPIMREGTSKAATEFKINKDPQIIDIILDSYMFKDMLSKAMKLENEFIINYLKISIDLINIKTLFRVKKQNKDRDFLMMVILSGGKLDKDVFLNAINESMDSFSQKLSYTDYGNILKQAQEEYLNTGKMNGFEKLSENFIMDIMKDTKFISFGPEPLLAYLIAKETEIKNIRIIMVGKLNKVAPAFLRERLRELYV